MSQQGGSKQRKLYSCYLEERKLFNQPIKAGSRAKTNKQTNKKTLKGIFQEWEIKKKRTLEKDKNYIIQKKKVKEYLKIFKVQKQIFFSSTLFGTFNLVHGGKMSYVGKKTIIITADSVKEGYS